MKHLTFPIEMASEDKRGKPASEAAFPSFRLHFGSASKEFRVFSEIRMRPSIKFRATQLIVNCIWYAKVECMRLHEGDVA